MTKRSPYERGRRAAETERMKQIEAAWQASLPAETAKAFARDVAAARARGPLAPAPNQPKGTVPNPPRPGHEPKAPKDDRKGRRGGSR